MSLLLSVALLAGTVGCCYAIKRRKSPCVKRTKNEFGYVEEEPIEAPSGPETEDDLEKALSMEGSSNGNLKGLKRLTFDMIERYPANEEIVWSNCAAFYQDHRYALEVIRRLEGKLREGEVDAEICWSIAYIAAQIALPPEFLDEDERQDFLHFFGFPDDIKFPKKDPVLVEKSIEFYRKAIDASRESVFETTFCSEQLARLLRKLGRGDEALAVMEEALPSLNAVARPGFLVEYGRCLISVGRISAARSTLEDVRASDHGDSGFGPACQTTEAENLLGEIAMDLHEFDQARRYLLSSCDVKKCCHNTMQGFPLRLARRLLESGECDAVITYCRTAITIFGVGNRQTKALLDAALAAKEKGQF